MEFIKREDILSEAKFSDNRWGHMASGVLMNLLRIDKMNELYDRFYPARGIELIDKVLDHLNIRVDIDEEELRNIPKTGPFVLVSNHPFGLLDGLIMISAVGKVRPDLRVMANFLLQRFEPIRHFFFPVNPFSANNGSMGGIKASLKHLQEGNALGMFPAGEVSTFQGKDKERTVADKDWDPTVIKMIRKAQVPVVPVYFHGKNSMSFHLLGKIHPILRTLQLPNEFFRKQNKKIKMRIGAPISVKDQAEFADTEQLCRYLRARVYVLGSALSPKRFFRPNLRALKKPEPIVPAVDTLLLEREIEQIRERYLVTEHVNFEIFTAPHQAIPNILTEIGRLREVTFREVGEGSNRSIDLDEYDRYYEHLFIWDRVERRIVGAYRLGKGAEIAAQRGIEGFYTSTLFDMDAALLPILSQAVELGRSFVVKDYQQKPMPLFLLWKGILMFLLKQPDYRYLVGPVSISNDYSKVAQSYLIEFIKKNFFDHELAKLVRPKKEFEPNFKRTDADILIKDFGSDINKLDKLIADIEPKRFRVPVLLRQYIRQNARLLAFNIDPKFNNSLDGLILLDMQDVPEATLENLKRESK